MTPADLAESMVPVACELALLVRDMDAGAVAALLDRVTPEETRALLVVLAAMVPVEDASDADMLSWVPDEGPCLGAVPEPRKGVAQDCAERRMREYARWRAMGESVAGAGERILVSVRTAERYEEALIRAGKATWRGQSRAA